jgi:outer membrane protein assembly factor BamB
VRSLLHICTPIILSLTLIIVASVTLLGRTHTGAHAATTTIALYHNFGRPFSSFMVSGNGFGQNESVTITFDSTVIGTATALQTKFSQKVNVPGSATPGFHTVTATGQTTGSTASAQFLAQTWWVMFGFDAQNTHFNPDENVINSTNASQLVTNWTYDTKSIPSTPIVRKDNVYFSSQNGKVTVLRPQGGVMWSKTIPTTISSIGPAVYYGIVYVGADDNNMYAFNYNTGALLWTLPTGGPILSSTVIAAGTAYFGSGDGKLYAIGAESMTTPNIKWTYTTGGPISATPVLGSGGTVYVASQDGSLYAISKTGSFLWKYATGGSITSSPAVANGLVYVGSSDHKLYAINASTGQLAWSHATNGAISSSPAVDKTNVYIGSQDHSLYAFNALTGSPKWSYPTGGAVNSTPAVANGVVYVGSDDNSLYGIDVKSGSKLWRSATGGKIDASPVVSDGVGFVGSSDGNIYTFHL